MKFCIATGGSRKEKHWKNIEITWPEFLDRVKDTRRTGETLAEFKELSKEEQGEIKDVGGFVGGRLKDGSRKCSSVEGRSMLTLDMDYARGDVWDYITMFFNYTCCIYSTHKHTKSSPRLRLVIPLKRQVSSDEYQAAARRAAEDIGIEQFDDTTYEASRLMYWPSTSIDGEYVFKSQEGYLLDPDVLLSSFKSWKDVSLWPLSLREKSVVKRSIEKQEDPLIKGGVVGCFCRAYTMKEAIDKFLPDIYSPSSNDGRYTYIPSESSAGLVIYEDKFAYSHHGTDPAGGRLLNAFDIVRIHKFCDLDNSSSENTQGAKLPSYAAMQELAVTDDNVKRELLKERMEKASLDFSGDGKWEEQLQYKKDGALASTIDNIRLILQNDIKLARMVGYNEFAHRNELYRDLEWRGMDKGIYWTDGDDAALRHYLERVYGISNLGKTLDALSIVAEQNRMNPVKEYLNSLSWDGTVRLDTLLIDYLGAEDNPYTRAVTRKTLAAAVARIMNPGCKFDYMLLLVGAQGLGKSYLVNRLGGKWFSDSLTTVIGREAYEQLQGAWIVEMGELYAARKAEIEALKHFISKQEDIFREAYGRRTGVYPRQCIFVGTTNDRECLRDRTGNRRFWPVNVCKGKKNLWQDLDVDQVWAEAVLSYKGGEELYLKGALADRAIEVQAQHTEESDRGGMVYEYLETLVPHNWDSMDIYDRRLFLSGDSRVREGTVKRSRVCAMEVWCECLGGDPKQLSNVQAREIRIILEKAENFKRCEGLFKFSIYGRQRSYMRVDSMI